MTRGNAPPLDRAVAYHQAGCLEAAETIYRQLLADDPDDAPALYYLGVIGLQTGHPSSAIKLFEQAVDRNPGFADAFANLGIAFKQENRLEEAADAYRQAISINPDIAEAHSNLGNILKDLGQTEEAMAAYESALCCDPTLADAHSNLGILYRQTGCYAEATNAFEKALNFKPDSPDIMTNLAAALVDSGRPLPAVELLMKAIAIKPDLLAAHCCLGNCYREMDDPQKALSAYEAALQIDPANLMTLVMKASFLEALSKLDEALELTTRALVVDESHPMANVIAATCERRQGKFADAVDRLESVDFSGSTAKTQATGYKEMGLLFDRLCRYEAAFEQFRQSNLFQAVEWRERGVSSDRYNRHIQKLHARFSADCVPTWTPPVIEAESPPVFLVGFPRSGTTLLEQILKAHPDVETVDERPVMERVQRSLTESGRDYPECLANLDETDITELRDLYFDTLAKYAGEYDPAKTYIDKLPLNLVRAGLIHRIFPNAKFILALRHPNDCVLSGYMQYFEANPAMANFLTLKSAAEFYCQTMDLWQRYTDVLPINYIGVRYEDVVADLEGEARRMIDYLELDWSEDVMSYRAKAASRQIKSPSYYQVVEPIYGRAMGRWENYSPYFGEDLALLEPYIVRYGYGD